MACAACAIDKFLLGGVLARTVKNIKDKFFKKTNPVVNPDPVNPDPVDPNPNPNPEPEPELQGQKECPVCWDDKDAGEFHRLQCGHECCKGCLTGVVDVALNGKDARLLRCPACRQDLTDEDIEAIMRTEKYTGDQREELFKIVDNHRFEQQPGATHCHTPDCPGRFINDEKNPRIIDCEHCKRRYCSNCRLFHDMEISCDEAKKNDDANKADEEWMKNNTKPCPRCDRPIVREGGCWYVGCKCGHSFCYKCLGNHHSFECHNKEKGGDVVGDDVIYAPGSYLARRRPGGRNPFMGIRRPVVRRAPQRNRRLGFFDWLFGRQPRQLQRNNLRNGLFWGGLAVILNQLFGRPRRAANPAPIRVVPEAPKRVERENHVVGAVNRVGVKRRRYDGYEDFIERPAKRKIKHNYRPPY